MAAPSRLHQVLGAAFGVAVLIGNTIGVGILRTPGEVAQHLPSIGLFVLVWLAGGAYALLGAMSLAEPGAAIHRSGGQYPIVARALGPYAGFVVGWSDWLSSAASIALSGMVFGEYAAPLLPTALRSPSSIACGVVLVFAALQWKGVRQGDLAQQSLSAFKALAFALLAVAALIAAVPSSPPVAAVTMPAGTALLGAFVLALQSVIYTNDGWTGPLYFGAETVDAGRTIPRAMIGGVLTVLAIYLLLNLAMVRVLGLARMAGDPFPASSVGLVLAGPTGELVLRLVVLGSILGTLNALIMLTARVPVGMSEDGLFPRAFTTVNAGGTPTVAHAATVGVALAFILSGTFNTVLALAAFFFVANYLVSFSSVFVLRRTEPGMPRPFRVPGFPYTTGLVVLGSLAFLIGALVTDRANSLRSLLLLAASYPIYRMIRGTHVH